MFSEEESFWRKKTKECYGKVCVFVCEAQKLILKKFWLSTLPYGFMEKKAMTIRALCRKSHTHTHTLN